MSEYPTGALSCIDCYASGFYNRMMSGPYYGGGGYGGVQMAQPANVGSDEGNYVNGGFDQGAAEARQAFPIGSFAPYQGESLKDVVDAAFGTRMGVEGFFTSGQNSQTGRGACTERVCLSAVKSNHQPQHLNHTEENL